MEYDDGDYGAAEAGGQFDRKYDEAMALNARLKAMLAASGEGGPPGYDEGMYYEEEEYHRPAPKPTRRKATKKRTGPARSAKTNYTFDSTRLDDIGRGNERLMNALTRINRGSSKPAAARRPVKKRSSASINRRRANNKIMDENLAFLKRLQSVKASSSLSRDTMAKESRKQKKFANNCRQVGKKKKKKPRKPPADFVF